MQDDLIQSIWITIFATIIFALFVFLIIVAACFLVQFLLHFKLFIIPVLLYLGVQIKTWMTKNEN